MDYEPSFVRRHWRAILSVITIGALVILVIALRHQIIQTFENLSKVELWIVLLIIPVQVLNYHAQTRLYQLLFKTLGSRLSYKTLMRAAIELNFVNHVFPSGGVSGVSYLSLRLRSYGVRAGRTTVVQMMKLILTFASFEILLLLGIFALSTSGGVSNLTIWIASSLSTMLIVGTLLFAYVIGKQSRINAALTALTLAFNKLVHWLHLGRSETINVERAKILFDELHDNYVLFKAKLPRLKVPFWYAFLANVTEVLSIYVVYIAFGHWVNFGAVVLGYAVANFAGLISITPGGVGVYEALMTAVVVSAGVPARLVIPVTIMYRVFSILVQVPIGFVFYHRSLNAKAKP